MYCQKCGSLNPEGSKFCFSCGQPMGAVAAAQPAVEAQPAQPASYQPVQPQAQPASYQPVQPAAPKVNVSEKLAAFGSVVGAAASNAAGTTTGLAAKVGAAISALILLFVFLMPWADSPMCDALISYAQTTLSSYSSYLGTSATLLNGIESPTVTVTALVGSTELMNSFSPFLSYMMQMSGSSSEAAQIQALCSSFGVVAGFLKTYLILWVAAAVVMGMGVYQALFAKKGMMLMRIGLVAAAVLAIVWMILCANASGAVTTVVQSMGGSSFLVQFGNPAGVAATIWPILTLILGLVGTAGTIVLKK